MISNNEESEWGLNQEPSFRDKPRAIFSNNKESVGVSDHMDVEESKAMGIKVEG